MNYRLLSWVALATFAFTQPSLTWCQESRTETQTIFDGEVIVPGGKDYTATFSVPRGAQNASVSINIAAAGGGGNDITVFVTGVVVGRGHRSRGNRFSFDSGQRPYLNQVVRLPGPGRYWLMFDNTFSVLAQKNVGGNATLTYETDRSENGSARR